MKTIELNNFDLADLPEEKAVYAFYSRKDGTLGNCVFIGETDNLKERTIEHFSASEKSECLKNFIQSKIIILRYELMPNSDKEQRLDKEREWIDRFKPRCNSR